MAGTIPDAVLQPLQSMVIVATERLDRAQHPDDKNNNPYLDSAEAMLKTARRQLETGADRQSTRGRRDPHNRKSNVCKP